MDIEIQALSSYGYANGHRKVPEKLARNRHHTALYYPVRPLKPRRANRFKLTPRLRLRQNYQYIRPKQPIFHGSFPRIFSADRAQGAATVLAMSTARGMARAELTWMLAPSPETRKLAGNIT